MYLRNEGMYPLRYKAEVQTWWLHRREDLEYIFKEKTFGTDLGLKHFCYTS
jgi:hypothetical protein